MIPTRYLKRLITRLLAISLLFLVCVFVFNSLTESDSHRINEFELGHENEHNQQFKNIKRKDDSKAVIKESNLEDNKQYQENVKENVLESHNEKGAIDKLNEGTDNHFVHVDKNRNEKIENDAFRNKESVTEHGAGDDGLGDKGVEDQGKIDKVDKSPEQENEDGNKIVRRQEEHNENEKAEKDGRVQIEPPRDNRKQPSLQSGPGMH